MKLALILNVVDPLIGGVLIMGHRGTGKSTAVRALADLLPQISVVRECAFNCDPKVGGVGLEPSFRQAGLARGESIEPNWFRTWGDDFWVVQFGCDVFVQQCADFEGQRLSFTQEVHKSTQRAP